MRCLFGLLLFAISIAAHAGEVEKVVDVPTRPGVTQRFLFTAPADAKAAAILFAGGDGGLRINERGALGWGKGNFLVRTAPLFVENGIAVAILDAPSDHQSYPYLTGFRESAAHAADVKAVIAWLRDNTKLPVWLIGTSRGTQSVAAVATQLTGADAPRGIVLTSTILNYFGSRPVPNMPVNTLTIPVLVVHHEQDSCRVTPYRDVPKLMDKLAPVRDKELITFRGGESSGDPCEAMAYHGYSGLERDVVARIASWITAR